MFNKRRKVILWEYTISLPLYQKKFIIIREERNDVQQKFFKQRRLIMNKTNLKILI